MFATIHDAKSQCEEYIWIYVKVVEGCESGDEETPLPNVGVHMVNYDGLTGTPPKPGPTTSPNWGYTSSGGWAGTRLCCDQEEVALWFKPPGASEYRESFVLIDLSDYGCGEASYAYLTVNLIDDFEIRKWDGCGNGTSYIPHGPLQTGNDVCAENYYINIPNQFYSDEYASVLRIEKVNRTTGAKQLIVETSPTCLTDLAGMDDFQQNQDEIYADECEDIQGNYLKLFYNLHDYMGNFFDCEETIYLDVSLGIKCCNGDGLINWHTGYLNYESAVPQADLDFNYKVTPTAEAYSNGTVYDNGTQGDGIVLNIDQDYCGQADGPVIGDVFGQIHLEVYEIYEECIESITLKLYKYNSCDFSIDCDYETDSSCDIDGDFDCDIDDLVANGDVTYIGSADLTQNYISSPQSNEMTYTLSQIKGSAFDMNSCYFTELIYETTCNKISHGGRFRTNNCSWCKIEKDAATTVNMFPNPTSDFLFIEFDKPLLNTGRIEIINLYGQKVYDSKLERDTKLFKYDMSEYTPGVYLIHTKSANIDETTKIIIH